jgi:hypothetical protein
MKTILSVYLLLSVVAINAQTSWTADMVNKASKNVNNGITEYHASDDSVWKIGDIITLGNASGQGVFNFITFGAGIMTPVEQAPISFSGKNAEIKKIRIWGTKRQGRTLWITCKGAFPLNINIEKAIEMGEVETDGYTSDQALEELKKAKDKLDLGLITQEEFETLKAELSKYIK